MTDKTATLSEEEWALILEPLDFDSTLDGAPHGFSEAAEKLRKQLGVLPPPVREEEEREEEEEEP